ncbi:MAG: N-6 DNA methylase [Ktedonobacterales bacterium]
MTRLVARQQAQRIPAAGPEREALRQKGQFWTPAWVAEAMVGYALLGGADHLFDPAVGAGAFFRAAQIIGTQLGRNVTLLGTEVDPLALVEARQNGLTADDLAGVLIQDFTLHAPERRYGAIAANPPYIRHHRLPRERKAQLQVYSRQLIGAALDGRAGLHNYFLLRALESLDENGRLAIILPADTCEGTFAPLLWRWITEHYCLEAVVSFAPEAGPFPTVDTNALIFLLRHAPPQSTCLWARCSQAATGDLTDWTVSGFQTVGRSLTVYQRQLDEALATGLSRAPQPPQPQHGAAETSRQVTLGDFATVMRGIATGANDFFFLSQRQAQELAIPAQFLRPAVGRTRDVQEAIITSDTLRRLNMKGRPTQLLALDGRAPAEFPVSVQAYLAEGMARGLPMKSLISTRKPWYKMERRVVPPILFAYLGRRNIRFIRNSAGVLPLTGFLCIYPHATDAASLERLWRILQHPATLANLPLVGKSYGSGAIKVEPRALERLPIPAFVLRDLELSVPELPRQAVLL